MKRPNSFLLLTVAISALFIAFMAAISSAAGPSAKFDPAKLKAVREKIQPFVDSGEIAGAVVAVGNAEGLVTLEALGERDLATHDAMKNDSLFLIASMTKPITAISVAILAEEGKLSFDDPVEEHLPEFRGQRLILRREGNEVTTIPAPRPITIREILTHTSGMPGGPPPGLSELYRRRNRGLAQGVLAFSQQPLEFEPGTRWSYSNTGIDTAGRIVEVVSGMHFDEFLEERVFGPLKMKDTTFYPIESQLARLATNYDRKDGQLVPAKEPLIGVSPDAKYPIPAGGLCSTAPDLARLYTAILRGGELEGKRILTEASLHELTKLQTGELQTGFVPGMGFGLGFAHVREPQGVTAALSPGSFGHGGAFGTQAWIDPTKGWYSILLIQRVGLPNADASDMRATLQNTAAAAIVE